MPVLKSKVPKLSKHHKGYAFVKIDGRQIWLGRYGDALTQEKYDRFVAEWLANGRRLPVRQRQSNETAITLSMLLNEYWQFAQGFYRKPDGSETSTLPAIKSTIRVLRKHYGSTPAIKFGPNHDQVLDMAYDQMGMPKEEGR